MVAATFVFGRLSVSVHYDTPSHDAMIIDEPEPANSKQQTAEVAVAGEGKREKETEHTS